VRALGVSRYGATRTAGMMDAAREHLGLPRLRWTLKPLLATKRQKFSRQTATTFVF